MTNFITNLFLNRQNKLGKTDKRENLGVLSGIVGICCNILLFVIKLVIGILSKSVSITADSFNNLSDSFNSIVSIIGFKMSNKPPDKEHPFGHGRIEYVSSLVVSFIILFVGFEFFLSSVKKIFNPEKMLFNPILLLILIITVLVKVWLYFFYKKIDKTVDSTSLDAAAKDSINDVFITLATILSMVAAKFMNVSIDGYVGILVSGILIYTGVEIFSETISAILGEPVPKDFALEIKNLVESYDGIIGSHDLIVHNYGPNKSMATIHVEVSNDDYIEVSHNLIDKIEDAANSKLGIFLLIHMDPVDIKDERLFKIRKTVSEILEEKDNPFNAHDFRITGTDKIVSVYFDLTVPFNYDAKKVSSFIKETRKKIKKINENYNVIVYIERSYI